MRESFGMVEIERERWQAGVVEWLEVPITYE